MAAHDLQLDRILLQQVEEICSGESVHLHANLAGAYRSALAEYQNTGDERYRVLAEEAHRALRIFLAKMRMQRGLLIQWE